MQKIKLIKQLKDLGVVSKGSFVLHSGIVSDYYVNIKKAYGNPKMLSQFAKLISEQMPKNITCIAATGHGGIPLASAISVIKKIPLILIRETEKDHGTMSSIDGYIPGKSDVIAIVDDVYSTGSSIHEVTLALKNYKSKVIGSFVVIWRGKGKKPKSLNYILKIGDLI